MVGPPECPTTIRIIPNALAMEIWLFFDMSGINSVYFCKCNEYLEKIKAFFPFFCYFCKKIE